MRKRSYKMSLPDVINQVLAVRNDTALLKEAEEKPKKEVLFDFEKGDFILDEFKRSVTTTDKKEIIKQWLLKLFRTYRNRFKIYIGDREAFGLIWEEYIGQIPYIDLALSEIERDIKETVLIHRFILSLKNVKVEFEDDDLNVSFTVITDEIDLLEYKDVI